MISVVLDANALVSGAVAPSGPLADIFDAWESGALVVFLSTVLRDEAARALRKPYFQQRLTPEFERRFDFLTNDCAQLVDLTVEVSGVATHPEDDLVLATAVCARAEYLVTGDAQLQKLGSYEGITIVSPRAFLTVLEETDIRSNE